MANALDAASSPVNALSKELTKLPPSIVVPTPAVIPAWASIASPRSASDEAVETLAWFALVPIAGLTPARLAIEVVAPPMGRG